MKGLFVAMLVAVSVSSFANGGEMYCDYQGYAESPETFHDLDMTKVRSDFVIKSGYVVYQGTTYNAVDPQAFDLKGLALTYLNKWDGSVLYLYTTESGEREVGISQIEVDSDNFFKDKRVFSKCSLVTEDKGNSNVTAESLLGIKEGGN